MKKLLSSSLVFLTLMCTSFATDYKIELHTLPSVRQLGMGGNHVTDTNTYDSLYENPALLANSEKHALLPSLDVRLTGPLDDVFSMVKDLSSVDAAKLFSMIEKNNGIKLGASLFPLLNFGCITESGFAWGFSTNIYVKGILPSVMNGDFAVGVEPMFTAGYGMSILETEMHDLSVGVSGKVFGQWQATYVGSPLKLASVLKSFDKYPLYVSTGFGFDAGVLYTFADSLNVGLTWKDICTPVFTATQTIKTMGDSLTFSAAQYISPTLALGVGYSIPVDWSNGIVSSFKVMGDYENLITLFQPLGRNPILELSLGTELVLFKFLSLRVGLYEMYPNVGAGLRFGKFNIDFAMYGRELGLEPGSSPVMNMALYMGCYW